MIKKFLGEHLSAKVLMGASIAMHANLEEQMLAIGTYTAWCERDGVEIWRDEFPNTVVTVGKNLMLDTALAGSAYTVTGPFLGLISSTSFTAISASDTMSSHSG